MCPGEGQVPCVHPFPPPLTVCLTSLTEMEVKVVGLDPSFVNCTWFLFVFQESPSPLRIFLESCLDCLGWRQLQIWVLILFFFFVGWENAVCQDIGFQWLSIWPLAILTGISSDSLWIDLPPNFIIQGHLRFSQLGYDKSRNTHTHTHPG